MLQTKILPKARQMLTKPNSNYENFMNRNYLIGIIGIAFLLNACSSWNLQKRRYTKGYYLSIRGPHTQIKENPAPNNSQPLAQANSPQHKAPLSNIKPLQNTWSTLNEQDSKPKDTKIQVKKHNTHKPSQQGFINPLNPLKTKFLRLLTHKTFINDLHPEKIKLFCKRDFDLDSKVFKILEIIGLILLTIFMLGIVIGNFKRLPIYSDVYEPNRGRWQGCRPRRCCR